VIAPRNLIELVEKAREAQLRCETRSPREYRDTLALIEPDSVRKAHQTLSVTRVQDTLLAEAADLAPLIERFRDKKAEHNIASLSALLAVPEQDVRVKVKPLVEIGFLEESGATFKVPMLYREGMSITQGKAWNSSVGEALR
jgi:Fic family protein